MIFNDTNFNLPLFKIKKPKIVVVVFSTVPRSLDDWFQVVVVDGGGWSLSVSRCFWEGRKERGAEKKTNFRDIERDRRRSKAGVRVQF